MPENTDETQEQTDPKDTGTPTPKDVATPKTFTQEQVNAFLADQKRAMQTRYADYDEYKAAAARLTELEQANKTQAQINLERAQKAEQALEQETANRIRAQAAATHGVPQNLLWATTEEQANEQAQALKAYAQAQAAPGPKSSSLGDPTTNNNPGPTSALEAALADRFS